MSSTIEVPADHLPALLETAAREVTTRGDNLSHAEEANAEAMAEQIAQVEEAIAAYKDVIAGLPLADSTVLFLAEAQISWEAGDTDVSLPSTADECDEFVARVERQRRLIDIRDRLAETAS